MWMLEFLSSTPPPPVKSCSITYGWIHNITHNFVSCLLPSQNQCQIDESPPESRLSDRRGSTDSRRRGSVLPSRAQSLTEQEMRINLEVPSYNFPGGRRGSGNHLMVPDDESPYLLQPQTKPSFDQCRPTSPTSAAFLQMHSRVRRHRSLPSPGFTNPTPPSPFAVKNQTRSSSFRRPVSLTTLFTCMPRKMKKAGRKQKLMDILIKEIMWVE